MVNNIFRNFLLQIGSIKISEWISDRVKERTTWDGVLIIAVALTIILFGGVVKLLAWLALIYGAWTLIAKEQ